MRSVRPGDVLADKYRVERVLGSGGMGYVVAARHLQLDQLVAMKFLRTDSVDEVSAREASARFAHEAKAAVKLKNEHVARVFDIGTLDSGEPYMVLEYLDGCDSSALATQRGSIPAAEAADYVLQACEALAEAHSLGIIHRDIKLANLFVTRGPSGAPLVKVLDFGVSKTSAFGDSAHGMTSMTSMLGSPRFMSPEQMRDARMVDGRTDIWSLGVVLYRLVSGRPPFEAETLGALFSMVMHDREAPLSMIRGDLPPGFEDVVARCLEKDPSRRFSNVAELAYALAAHCTMPDRARSVADAIAATLSISPQGAWTEPATSPLAGRSRADTGTAGPWAAQTMPSTRAELTGIGTALAALLVVAGLAANAKREPPSDATAAAPIAVAVPAVLNSAASADSSATVATAPVVVASTPTMPVTTSTSARPPPASRPTRATSTSVAGARSKAPKAAKPATLTPRATDGLPTTRD